MIAIYSNRKHEFSGTPETGENIIELVTSWRQYSIFSGTSMKENGHTHAISSVPPQ